MGCPPSLEEKFFKRSSLEAFRKAAAFNMGAIGALHSLSILEKERDIVQTKRLMELGWRSACEDPSCGLFSATTPLYHFTNMPQEGSSNCDEKMFTNNRPPAFAAMAMSHYKDLTTGSATEAGGDAIEQHGAPGLSNRGQGGRSAGKR